MRPYQLKRDILYHAIQGKLVPQIDVEGTGHLLLQKNEREKASLPIAIQKRIGKGCKPILETELPFDIPDSWDWERFGNLVINFDSQRKPVTKSDRKTTKGLYDYYGATGAIDKVDDFIFDGEYLMIGEDGGNFFVDRDNSFIAKGAFWANNHVHVVQPIVCDISYLKACLDAYDLPNLGVINGIAVPKLNQENMNSILIPVPPLGEQKRIVSRIEELLPLVERYEKAWSRLEDFNKRFPGDMQKSILQMAIQGKLVEQRPEEGTGEELYRQIQAEKQALIQSGKLKKQKPLPEITEDETPFDIPESWKWVYLIDISLIIGDIDHKMPQKVENNGIPYISPLDFTTDGIDYDNAKQITYDDFQMLGRKITPSRDDIIFPRYGTIGVIRQVKTDRPFLVSYSCCTIKNMPNMMIPKYVFFVLKTPMIHEEIRKYINKTTQPNVGLASIKRFLFPLPPLAEQKRIVTRLEELLPLCERLK